MVHIHSEILCSRKKEGYATCDNMKGLEDIMLSEIRRIEKDKHQMISLTCEI